MDSEQMIFTADGRAELHKCIGRLETRVPSRKERTTGQCEQWMIHAFLECLEREDCLQTPISLKKRERPDYELSLAKTMTEKSLLLFGSTSTESLMIGVECSEVIDQTEAERLAYEEEEQDVGTLIQLWCGDGYVGDICEVEFAESISRAVKQKQKKLISGFDRFEKDILLLYYNNFRPTLRKKAAVSKTRERLGSYWTGQGFDAVIVYVDGTMLVFMSDCSEIFTSQRL